MNSIIFYALLCSILIASTCAQDSPFPTSIKDVQDQLNGVIKGTGDLAQHGVNTLGGLATDLINVPENFGDQGSNVSPPPPPPTQ